MDDVLLRIKRSVLSGRYVFSEKASDELEADGLTELDAIESIVNAVAIYKTIRSMSPRRGRARELLHIIMGSNMSGAPICTKGKLVGPPAVEICYFLISSKKAE